MSLGKASILRAAGAGTKKASAHGRETAHQGAAAGRNTAPEAPKSKRAPASCGKSQTAPAESVISPMDADDIQVKFLTGMKKAPADGRPVRITETLPDYLL